MEDADPRIRRTRRMLGEALIELSLEKGFDNVTIQDVTDRADIAYRTFFRHYRDLNTLLIEAFETRMNDWRDELTPFKPVTGESDARYTAARESGRRVFEYVEANQDLFLVVFGPNGCRSVEELIFDYSRERTKDRFEALNRSDIETEIIAEVAITATFGLVKWWLTNDGPVSPARMGEVFARLIIEPAWEAMDVER